MRRRSLEEALRAVGSVSGLARRLSVPRRTLRGWLAKTPKKRGGEGSPEWRVESLLREIRSAKQKSREEENVFHTLLKLAGEADVLGKSRSGEGRRSGRLTAGYQWTKSFRRELSRRVIVEVESWTHSFGRGKNYPLWQGTAMVAQYALHPSKAFNSGQRAGSPKPHELVVQLRGKDRRPHPEAGQFAAEIAIPTRAGKKADAVADLTDKLTSIQEDPLVRTFLYSVRFVNYRRRSEREQREARTKARRERKQKQARANKRAVKKAKPKKVLKRATKKRVVKQSRKGRKR